LWWWYARDRPEEHQAVNDEEIKLIQAGREEQLKAESHAIGLSQLLKNRDVFWLTFSYFCMQYTFYVVLSWFFYFLVEIRGFSMSDAGWLTSAQWIAGAVGATVGGWYCDKLCRRIGLRWGCRLPLVIGGVASALCLLGGIFIPSQSVAVFLLIACLFFNQVEEAPYWTTQYGHWWQTLWCGRWGDEYRRKRGRNFQRGAGAVDGAYVWLVICDCLGGDIVDYRLSDDSAGATGPTN
jgi:ACS family glucarate transporter-like MFS transporter